MLLLYAVALGVIAGLATRGSLAAIGTVKIRLWPIALCGLAFQGLLFSSPLAEVVGKFGPSLYVVSTTLVLMALVVNLRQPGFWLITLGALANFTVIVANGGQMPASPEAFAMLNGLPVVPTTDFSNSVIAAPGAPFHYLGDIFVLPRPIPFANVFSIGDALIGVGGAWFIVAAMHSGAAKADKAPSTDAQPAPTRQRRRQRASSDPTRA
ncbi:MAG: DUF5317 domain-containing protein [Candidatus Limnocylindrales bacterium]